jgi:hypothetical protein
MKIQVGQKIFLKKKGSSEPQIVEATVTKIGKTYFTAEYGRLCVKFYIDGMCEADSHGHPWNAYFSMQEIKDENEQQLLGNYLYHTAEYRFLTLDQLRRIKAIVEEKK